MTSVAEIKARWACAPEENMLTLEVDDEGKVDETEVGDLIQRFVTALNDIEWLVAQLEAAQHKESDA